MKQSAAPSAPTLRHPAKDPTVKGWKTSSSAGLTWGAHTRRLTGERVERQRPAGCTTLPNLRCCMICRPQKIHGPQNEQAPVTYGPAASAALAAAPDGRRPVTHKITGLRPCGRSVLVGRGPSRRSRLFQRGRSSKCAGIRAWTGGA